MFPHSYFPTSYFSAAYWPPGESSNPAVVEATITAAYSRDDDSLLWSREEDEGD